MAVLIAALLGAALPGCNAWPLGGKVSDTVPGITPPNERIADLKKLAAAPPKDPAERERIASEVAAQYPREPDPLIRTHMVDVLGAYPGPTALAALAGAAKDADSDVRIAVCKALARQKGPEATALLRQVFAGNTDVDVRLAAVHALGETRDPVAMATLVPALEDRDPAMQYRVVESLRKVAPRDLGDNVEQWRQYVGGQSARPESTPLVAEPVRRPF
jgi:HEAT repeat protein